MGVSIMAVNKSSWKTSLAGICLLIMVIVRIVHNEFHIDGNDLTATIAAIGFLFTKDFDVVGKP